MTKLLDDYVCCAGVGSALLKVDSCQCKAPLETAVGAVAAMEVAEMEGLEVRVEVGGLLEVQSAQNRHSEPEQR